MKPAATHARPCCRRGAEVTLGIDRLAYGGRGVGRVDGYVVFVPDTAPGDRARARLWRVKPSFAEADLVEVESPSALRTVPPCPHFGPCGGCVWQHLGYADQLRAKESIVRESLAHLARLGDVEVGPILEAADPWAYRNKMEFTFHPDGTLGLHRRGAFFQTNTAQAERLIEVVEALAAVGGGQTVYDLYCGVGTFSLALARRAGKVYGLEIVTPAIDAARENAALNGIGNAEFIPGDVRRVLPDLVSRVGSPDLLVLDPPRSGAGSRVMRKIIGATPPRIVYVSCNPTTLAPDLGELVGAGYAIRRVQPMDLFPHTHHVECVAILDRGGIPQPAQGGARG